MMINGGNLAEQSDPLVDQNEDDIQIVIEAFSEKLNHHVAYQLSHKELRECSLGRLDFNSIVAFMIDRLRESHGEEA